MKLINLVKSKFGFPYKNPFILGMEFPDDIGKFLLNTNDLLAQLGANVGNLAFHESIINMLDIKKRSIWWESNYTRINNYGDIAIIPCANHLRPNFKAPGVIESLSKVKIPLVAVGLGRDGKMDEFDNISASDDIIEIVKIIINHAPTNCPNISLRSSDAYELLKKMNLHESSIVLGCPSLFINKDKFLGKRILNNCNKISRIAILGGNFRWNHLSELENKLTKLIGERDLYIVQHPLEMVKLAREKVIDEYNYEIMHKFMCAYKNDDEYNRFIKFNMKTFFNINEWLECYNNYDFVIGARIHGTIIALSAGKPAICIAHDARTLEMCKFMKIPYIKYNELSDVNINFEYLMQKFLEIFDAKTFDENRRFLAEENTKFYKNNKIVCRSIIE